MEKIIYPIWLAEGSDKDQWRDRMRANTLPALLEHLDLRAARLTVADSAVDPAAKKRLARREPLPDAVLSLWLDNAGERQKYEALLTDLCERFEALLVTESEPLRNREQQPAADGRLPGFCQVVFLQTPPRLSRDEWLSIWQGSHTSIAIETQSTFAYRQNVVARVLETNDAEFAPDAMIEENFSDAAMTSDMVFYAAADEAELARHSKMMMDSCARFIDFDRIDVIPMSEYIFGEILQPLAS